MSAIGDRGVEHQPFVRIEHRKQAIADLIFACLFGLVGGIVGNNYCRSLNATELAQRTFCQGDGGGTISGVIWGLFAFVVLLGMQGRHLP